MTVQFGQRKIKVLSCKPATKGIKCLIPEYNRVVWPELLDIETLRRRPTKKNPNPDVGTHVTLNKDTATFLFDDDSKRPKRYVLNKNGEIQLVVEMGLGRTYTVCSAVDDKLGCRVNPVLYEERVIKEGERKKKVPVGPPPGFEEEIRQAAQELEQRMVKEHDAGAVVSSDLVPLKALKREGEIGVAEEVPVAPHVEPPIPAIYEGIHAGPKIYKPLEDFVGIPGLWGRYEKEPEHIPGKHRARKMKKGKQRQIFGGGKYPEGHEPPNQKRRWWRGGI